MFNNIKNDNNDKNLLTSGTRYYHKNLKIVSEPTVVERDIDKGTLISRTPEYYLEPTASYTVQDFIQYFYKTMPIDLQAQPMSKMFGMFKYKINQYGIDKVLYMTDIAADDCIKNNTVFNLGTWDEYSYVADQYMNKIKSVFSDNEQYYTIKKRKLFDE